MQAREGIRSIARALDLLYAMNERQPCSLAELHCATGLPKPTVFRILATLQREGYVKSEGTQGQYHLTAKVRRLGAAYSDKLLVVDVGAPLTLKVTRAIKWPLAIGVIDGDSMIVRHSTMPYSPFAVQATTVGHRLGLLRSAQGGAYLAFCDEAERSILLDMLQANAALGGMEAVERLREVLELTRKRGYGLRLAEKPGESASVAVPILRGSQIPGVISMTTFGRTMNSKTLSTFVPVLKRTAQEIARAMDASEGKDLSLAS